MNIRKSFDKALADYGMVGEGDRILIGASGGKDSLALSSLLAWRAARGRPRFSLMALRVVGGGAPAPSSSEASAFRALYSGWGIPLELRVLAAAPSGEGGGHSCYRCAALRRAALMRYALDSGCNKIALGHHLDDILTTLLMNLLVHGDAGERGDMEPLRHFERFGVSLIRPLAYTPEETIRRYVLAGGWKTTTCTCPAGTQGVRTDFRSRLEVLTGGSLDGKLKLYRGLAVRRRPPNQTPEPSWPQK